MRHFRTVLFLLLVLVCLATASVGGNRLSAIPIGDQTPVKGPISIGWDDGWIVYNFSIAENKWLSWKSPRSPLPRRAVAAIGKHRVVILENSNKLQGWLFDLKNQTWREIPPNPFGWLGWGPFVELFDDKFLVWGSGEKNEPSGLIFDIKATQWKAIPPSPILPRTGCAHALIRTKLVVWGGYAGSRPAGAPKEAGGPQSDGAVFDLHTNSWEKMPAAPITFKYGIAFATWNSRFVIVDGYGSRAGAIFDPTNRSWQKLPAAPFEVGIDSACAVIGDSLFLWSGSAKASRNGALYHFRKEAWEKIPAAPIPPRLHAFTYGQGNKIYVWGGWDYKSVSRREPEKYQFFRSGSVFDMTTKQWAPFPDVPGDTPLGLR